MGATRGPLPPRQAWEGLLYLAQGLPKFGIGRLTETQGNRRSGDNLSRRSH